MSDCKSLPAFPLRQDYAAIVPETVVGTNGILVPPSGYPAGGRELRREVRGLGACKANGVRPFTHFNPLQVTPPCTTTADAARERLAAIDRALEVADRYREG